MKRNHDKVKRNKRVIGETLAHLDFNAGHLRQTARETEIPIPTIARWRDVYRNDPEVRRYCTLKNEELADRFRAVAALAIERLHREIDQVSTDKIATVAAICTDKQLLLTGQPTNISGKPERQSQLDSARNSYLLAAIPELQSAHPEWTAEQLQHAATKAFSDWYASLQPMVTEDMSIEH